MTSRQAGWTFGETVDIIAQLIGNHATILTYYRKYKYTYLHLCFECYAEFGSLFCQKLTFCTIFSNGHTQTITHVKLWMFPWDILSLETGAYTCFNKYHYWTAHVIRRLSDSFHARFTKIIKLCWFSISRFYWIICQNIKKIINKHLVTSMVP